MKFSVAISVTLCVASIFFDLTAAVDPVDDLLAEESRVQLDDAAVPENNFNREKRGLQYQYVFKEKSVGGLFPFKQTVKHKVHIKHGHGLFGGQYREVTKVKQFGLGR